MVYSISKHDSIIEFEQLLKEKSQQEKQTKGEGPWLRLAENYIVQRNILSQVPIPEYIQSEEEDFIEGDTKKVNQNTKLLNLYRLGLPSSDIGNYLLLYVFHNYYRVILLHRFDKEYNGLIRREDIIPAEKNYEEYCVEDPSCYQIYKEE